MHGHGSSKLSHCRMDGYDVEQGNTRIYNMHRPLTDMTRHDKSRHHDLAMILNTRWARVRKQCPLATWMAMIFHSELQTRTHCSMDGYDLAKWLATDLETLSHCRMGGYDVEQGNTYIHQTHRPLTDMTRHDKSGHNDLAEILNTVWARIRKQCRMATWMAMVFHSDIRTISASLAQPVLGLISSAAKAQCPWDCKMRPKHPQRNTKASIPQYSTFFNVVFNIFPGTEVEYQNCSHFSGRTWTEYQIVFYIVQHSSTFGRTVHMDVKKTAYAPTVALACCKKGPAGAYLG